MCALDFFLFCFYFFVWVLEAGKWYTHVGAHIQECVGSPGFCWDPIQSPLQEEQVFLISEPLSTSLLICGGTGVQNTGSLIVY